LSKFIYFLSPIFGLISSGFDKNFYAKVFIMIGVENQIRMIETGKKIDNNRYPRRKKNNAFFVVETVDIIRHYINLIKNTIDNLLPAYELRRRMESAVYNYILQVLQQEMNRSDESDRRR